MYHIDNKKDKPDIGYMIYFAQQLMKRGIRVANCKEMLEYYKNLRDTLEADFIYKYNVQNPRSPKQLVEYLKSLANSVDINSKNDIINICYKERENKWTTDAPSMNRLADLGYEFASDLLDYRHAKKYADSVQEIIDACDENGLVHPKVSVTKTNRLSYAEPALMNIPKQLLWVIIKPYTNDKSLYSVDIKNQEPHILISMTGAKELEYALKADEGLYETMFRQCFKPTATANVLIDTFVENRVYTPSEIKQLGTISPALYSPMRPSASMYLHDKKVMGIETVCVGSEKGVRPQLPDSVYVELEDGSVEAVSVEWDESEIKINKAVDYTVSGRLKEISIKISKAERKEFKTSWLAISYGSGIENIKEVCKLIDGKRVYNYITKISAIKEYRSKISKLASSGVNTIGTIFGTRLYTNVDPEEKFKLKRVLLDLPIQGSGADILSLLIKHYEQYTKENNLEDKIKVYYTRHDEFILEVDKQWETEVGEQKVIETLNDMFEHQINDWVPFKMEVSKLEEQDTDNLIRFEDEDE